MSNKRNDKVERPSLTIFALRKERRLIEAYQLAMSLINQDSNDDIKKAFSWVLIDLCKKFISEQNFSEANNFFNQLSSIQFDYEDEFIETINNQIHSLKPKIDTNYLEIQKADTLSKNGNVKEALEILENLISQKKLKELHHESYGWILYRYIKTEKDNLSVAEIKKFLKNYLDLKNERPSLLHSKILNFALNFSKIHKDFKFYNFFLLWNPNNLRLDDMHDENIEGKKIPSLITRICREFVSNNIIFDIDEILISKIKPEFINKETFLSDFDDVRSITRETILDSFRESFYWNIFNAHKENRFSDLWNLFEQYNANYSKYGQSKWHSKILNLAERFMNNDDELSFLKFFKNWNPEYLRTEDWKETIKDEHTYIPLAKKVIKKAYEILKTQRSKQDLSWLIKLYETAIKLSPDDEWLLREKALLHFKNNELELAIKIYKQLVLELGEKYYVWQEFSNCIISDNFLKIGMLSKALSLEKNEDFLGDIHLNLAKALIEENLFENAHIELETYKKHREIKGWKLSVNFGELQQKTSSIKVSLKDNRELYKKYISFAENFAYADYDWTELVLVDKLKDDKGRDRLRFTDGNSIEFAIGKNRFEVLKQLEIGQMYRFKIHKQKIKNDGEVKFSWFEENFIKDYKYVPLIAEKSIKKPWEILDDTFALVDFINEEKKRIHAITKENYEVSFPQIKNELHVGDFVMAKYFIREDKNKKRMELRQIQKIDKDVVISKFQNQVAIVDHVNEQKQLFHFVISSRLQGIVKYTETNIRPNEGDFIMVTYVTKKDIKRLDHVKVLYIEPTEEINTNLLKDITGLLVVKYKNGFDPGTAFDETGRLEIYNKPNPDFAFIRDYYVPKYILEKHSITGDCQVNAKAIFNGEKWKVIELEKN